MIRFAVGGLTLCLWAGCSARSLSGEEAGPDVRAARVFVRTDAAVGEVSERYLSVALDVAQVVGGDFWSKTGEMSLAGDKAVPPFDFERPRLLELARALGPAYLRVGGSAADMVHLDLTNAQSPMPRGARYRLTGDHWAAMNRFAREADMQLVFTLNAGPESREGGDCVSRLRAPQVEAELSYGRGTSFRLADGALRDSSSEVEAHIQVREDPLAPQRAPRPGQRRRRSRHPPGDGSWCPDAAFRLVNHARERGDVVAVWELGNEPNAFPLMHGHWLSGAEYGRDLWMARDALDSIAPGLKLAGPASAYWPRAGEIRPVLPQALKTAGDALDILTWHYYPQQSRRCPAATRRAELRTLLEPSALDEVRRWAEQVDSLRREHAPGAELWMGETGNAQCGGEPGVSDRFVSSLWWLDQLGVLARTGHQVVIRQTLAGSDYGIIEEATLEPRPDYWASLLWKRLMGRRVLFTAVENSVNLRVYAHCAAKPNAGVTLLAINVGTTPIALRSPILPTGSKVSLYQVTAERLDSPTASLNGHPLRWEDGLGAIRGRSVVVPERGVVVPPESYSFVVTDARSAPACR